MPLIEERLRVLKEAGNVLLEKFDGSFLNCIKKSENNAQKLLMLVVENFPSYRDETVFQVSLLCLSYFVSGNTIAKILNNTIAK